MLFNVYVLQCNDGTCYVGMTSDLKRRMQQHEYGQVFYTKIRLPVKLIFVEQANDRKAARVREKYWKSGAGREKLKRITADLPMGKA